MKIQQARDECWLPNVGGQRDFFLDREHWAIALEGGWSSGKTWVGARKLLQTHLDNAFDDAGRPTYIKSAIIAPTYASARDYCVPALLAAAEEIGLECHHVFSISNFNFPDLGTRERPSTIIVRTSDKPDRIAGWEVGAAWGDEAARWKVDWYDPRQDPYVQLTARVRDPRARFCQLMLTYTNEGDATRVYREFHAGHSTHKLYRALTKENPCTDDFLVRQMELLSPELQRQYLDGEAINLRGNLLYSQFDEARHIEPALVLTYEMPLHIALDFNISPGMHALLGHYDQHHDMFGTVEEIFEPRLDVRGVVVRLSRIIERLGGWKWTTPLEVFGDATGASQWAGTGESCYQILAESLEAAGIPFRIRVPRVNPPVVDRINAVNCALLDARGKVHWKIHPSCRRLLGDLRAMRFGNDGVPDKSDMQLSHASDADGYRVHYLRPIRRPENRPGGRISVTMGG